MLHLKETACAAWASILFASFVLGGTFGCTCQNAETTSPESVTVAPLEEQNGANETQAPLDPWSDAWLLARGQRYLGDAEHRRSSMLASLRNPKNLYSRQRIASYGFTNKGWDALPEWNPRSRVMKIETKSEPDRSRTLAPSATEIRAIDKLWNGARPTSMADWRKLGEQVFHRYPLRADAFVDFGVQADATMQKFGLHRGADGRIPGVVRFVDVDGKAKVGITCALCHSSVRDGEAIDGLARRDFDYGALRLAMHKATKTPVDPELARRMATWGPGRADITEDEAEDPVTIPDLWDLRHYESLTQAGTIRHIGPIALALRQETQLLHANHQRARPPRELSWALAMYLYSLEPPPRAVGWQAPHSEQVASGKALFDEQCARCHSNPAGGGRVVDAVKLGTDQALAFGVARGTGKYRPPNLTRVADAAPYFHSGTLLNLEALFDPRRLEENYVQATGKTGAIAGHAFALDSSPPDKSALIAYLRSL